LNRIRRGKGGGSKHPIGVKVGIGEGRGQLRPKRRSSKALGVKRTRRITRRDLKKPKIPGAEGRKKRWGRNRRKERQEKNKELDVAVKSTRSEARNNSLGKPSGKKKK